MGRLLDSPFPSEDTVQVAGALGSQDPEITGARWFWGCWIWGLPELGLQLREIVRSQLHSISKWTDLGIVAAPCSDKTAEALKVPFRNLLL